MGVWHLQKQKNNLKWCPDFIDHYILQYRARRRDLPHLSGHSFRVGAALDMLNAGVPLEKIMLRGGWRKETTTLRYLQSWVDNVNPAELHIEECTPVWEVTAFN